MTFTASNGYSFEEHDHSITMRSRTSLLVGSGAIGQALKEYVEHVRAGALREANHKPWHDAKEGEVWVFTTDEGTFPAFVETRFGDDGPALTFDSSTTEYALTDSGITAARRIWPEEERP